MPTVPSTPELLAYLREVGIDFSTGKPIEPEPEPGIPADIGETEFQAKVIGLAKDNGWLAFHNYDARRSEAGFPDTHLLKKSRQIVAELKTAKGKLSPAQKKWVNAYRRAGVEAYVWRPSDWPEIRRRLCDSSAA